MKKPERKISDVLHEFLNDQGEIHLSRDMAYLILQYVRLLEDSREDFLSYQEKIALLVKSGDAK